MFELWVYKILLDFAFYTQPYFQDLTRLQTIHD